MEGRTRRSPSRPMRRSALPCLRTSNLERAVHPVALSGWTSVPPSQVRARTGARRACWSLSGGAGPSLAPEASASLRVSSKPLSGTGKQVEQKRDELLAVQKGVRCHSALQGGREASKHPHVESSNGEVNAQQQCQSRVGR